jgi:hypothetical protein
MVERVPPVIDRWFIVPRPLNILAIREVEQSLKRTSSI